MALALAILQAIAAIPKIASFVDELVARYIASVEEKRRKNIQDADGDLKNAKTIAEKDAALLKRFRGGGNH